MSSRFTKSPQRWLLFIGLNLVQAAVLLALLFTWPSIAEGPGVWMLWLPVIAVNIVAARFLIVSPPRA